MLITFDLVLVINYQFLKNFPNSAKLSVTRIQYLTLKIRTTSSAGQIRTNITIKLYPSTQC